MNSVLVSSGPIWQSCKIWKNTKVQKLPFKKHTFLLLTGKKKKRVPSSNIRGLWTDDTLSWLGIVILCVTIGHVLGDHGMCLIKSKCSSPGGLLLLILLILLIIKKFSPVNSGSDSTNNHILTGNLGRIYQSKEFTLHVYRSVVDRHTSCVMNRHIDITSKNVQLPLSTRCSSPASTRQAFIYPRLLTM